MSSLLPTIIGLCFALGGPALIASIGDRFFGNSENITNKVLQQIVLAALFATVLAIVVFWEQQPLDSVGLHSLSWQSFVYGLMFAAVLIFIYSPLLMWAIYKLGIAGFEGGLAKLSSLPIWYLVLAVFIGGIVEEGLYRGYATERLSLLTGSYWLGSLFALVAFGIAHVPIWGWGAALTTVLSGSLLTLFYLWTGDLFSALIAHVVTDSLGIIIVPNFNCTS